MVSAQDVSGFAGTFKGSVIGLDDAGFVEACSLWNGTVTRHPRLIVRPTSAADVSATVKFAPSPPRTRTASFTGISSRRTS